MELAFPHEEGVELVQLLAVRQVEVVQQVDRFFEGRVAREVGDLVADVPEASEFTVDVRDVGVGGDDLPEPLLGHEAQDRGSGASDPNPGGPVGCPTMTTRVTLIPGDGIGPEVTEATRRVLEATGTSFEWDRQDMGAGAFSRTGRALPMETLDAIRASSRGAQGPIETPVTSGLRSSNLALRRDLDLFANVRPCKRYPGVPSVYDEVDLVVIRENTEGMYTGIELERGTSAVSQLIAFVGSTTGQIVRSDSGISVKEISASGAERIVRFAFEWARAHGRRRVTASHKANIMKYSDGLFLQVATEVAAAYPDIAFDDRIIDALCLQLIQAPERFDVLVLPNMYGDLVAELGAGLIGGTGVAPGAHFGGDGGLRAGRVRGHARHREPSRRHEPSRSDRPHPVGRDAAASHRRDRRRRSRRRSRRGGLGRGVFVTYDLRAPGDDRPAAGTFGVADAVIARL